MLASNAARSDCGSGPGLQNLGARGGLTLGFAAQPQPIRVGQHFALLVWLCPPGDAPVTLNRVDADMPAHRHGMNYRVDLTPLAPNQWRASGLMFHMPGRWRLQFDVSSSLGIERLEHEVDLP